MVAWGFNSSGQTNVPADLTNGLAVAGGLAHSLALRKDGTLIGWGLNSSNQTNILSDLTNVMAFAAGGYHNLVVTTNSWTTLPLPRFVGTLSLTTNNGSISRVKGLVGRGFVSYYGSTNLTNWQFVTFRSATVGECLFTNSSATNIPWRFYRVQESR